MKEERAAVLSLTKEEIKCAAVLSLHTYDGATAAEWQQQADTLREWDGGDAARNGDANLSQMIADALREIDEYLAERSSL